MADNSLWQAISVLMRVKEQLKEGSREQINRSGLMTVKQATDIALACVLRVPEGYIGIKELAGLKNVCEITTAFLAEEDYSETDLETKAELCSIVGECLHLLCMDAAEYYKTHTFNFSVKMQNIINTVLDEVTASGEFFGYDKTFKERRA